MELSNIRFKIVRATLCAATCTVTFITGITVAADLYAPLKNWLKLTFSHHWVGKGILAGAVFAAVIVMVSFIPAPEDDLKAKTLARSVGKLIAASLAGTLVIIIFFIYEAFFKH